MISMKLIAAATVSALISTAFAQDAMIDISGAMAGRQTITVPAVTAPADGYIVVHAMQEGQVGAPIGHATVKAGENKNVQVQLDTPVTAGQTYTLMLHQDTGEMGKFEFGMVEEADMPVMMDEKPVTASFQAP
jgi:hypothetical protein